MSNWCVWAAGEAGEGGGGEKRALERGNKESLTERSGEGESRDLSQVLR